ncbi:hypothetical protein P8C59_004421 [Phyllachora maydis]|uniref:Large ribosomal subunit protein bL28m n=1 Tax=Phyllachora maydis TaxID=1825666 RepID=A0AAD9I422_9PEZI|nr:hypothetical protein P8C59_004421 [Phyllachora maydis]
MAPALATPRLLAARIVTNLIRPGTGTALRVSKPSTPRLYHQPAVPESSIPIPSATARHPEIPPYPHGPHQVYHQSNTGLYGRQRIRFGNTVAVSAKHATKTRRAWRPNVHHKRLWSAALGVFVRTRVTTRVLRTIDKAGGLDNYLLGTKAARLRELGPWGWRLRWRVMQTDSVRERFARERRALGVRPREGDEELIARADLERAEREMGAAEFRSGEELVERMDAMLTGEEEFPIGEGVDDGVDGTVAMEAEAQAAAGSEAKETDKSQASDGAEAEGQGTPHTEGETPFRDEDFMKEETPTKAP